MKIHSLTILLTLFLFTFGLFSSMIYAADEAHLSAKNISFEETETGLLLTLEGPVNIVFSGDSLSSDNASIRLKPHSDTLEDAILRIDLSGNVSYKSVSGISGRSASVIYDAAANTVTFSGGASVTDGKMTATSALAIYNKLGRTISLKNGCTISEGAISAKADEAEYDLNTRSGSLAGNVEVTRTGEFSSGLPIS